MPIVDEKYVSPTWSNDSGTKLNASEMQAITDTVQHNQDYKIEKVPDALAGNFPIFGADGLLADSGLSKEYTVGSLAGLRTRIDALYKLTQGQIWDTQTDAQEAYQKSVPSGAVSAEIGSIGGKTVVWNQGVKNTTFETLDNIGKASRTVLTVNDGILNLTKSEAGGIGGNARFLDTIFDETHKYYMRAMARKGESATQDVYISFTATNYSTGGNDISAVTDATDFTLLRNITSPTATGNYFCARSGSATSGPDDIDAYFKDVRIVDLTMAFGAGGEPTELADPRIAAIESYLATNPDYDTGSLLSAAVTGVVSKDTDAETLDTLEIPAAVRALDGYGQSPVGGDGNTLNLADGTYTEIGHYVDGVWTALDTPVVTDVSALIPDNMMDAEAGGTLTFAQAGTEFPVPNSVDYFVKLTEVV